MWASRPERREHDARQAADREDADEAEGVEHRGLPDDRALVERRRPVEDLHRGGDGHEHRQDREDGAGVDGDAGDEHVVRPDEEAERRDGDRREGDELVAEDPLAGEGGDDLADDAHRRQDHDVDGGVRVEPEEVLEEDRVAAVPRVEEADVEEALGGEEKDRDGEDGRPEDLDQARRVDAPRRREAGGTTPGRAPASGGSSR